MTATTTPRLGLISPTSTDDFKTTEVAQTFGILDENPGIYRVDNQASRPTTWNHNQHGRTVRQMDQLIDWVWVQPTSGSVGAWKRVAPKGILHTQENQANVTSSATVYTSGATVIQTPSIILPGGRPIEISLRWHFFGNTEGIAVGSYWEGSTLQTSWRVNGYELAQPSHRGDYGMGGMYATWRDLAPTTQVSMSFKWTISAYGLNGIGGTTTIRSTVMVIKEV